MKTWISDTFPLDKLECQYFDQCRKYNPDNCAYDKPCLGFITLSNGFIINARDMFRHSLEDFVQVECLHYQIKLIMNDGKE